MFKNNIKNKIILGIKSEVKRSEVELFWGGFKIN